MGLFDVPEESFEIEILEDDLDVKNDKKIESEKIIDMDLLFQSALQCHNKNCHKQTVWFGTVDNAATTATPSPLKMQGTITFILKMVKNLFQSSLAPINCSEI